MLFGFLREWPYVITDCPPVTPRRDSKDVVVKDIMRVLRQVVLTNIEIPALNKWGKLSPVLCKLELAMGIHCFYHKSDDYVMTSQGWIWAYPGQPGGKYTIAVHPEKLHPGDVQKFAGVCSDYVEKFND